MINFKTELFRQRKLSNEAQISKIDLITSNKRKIKQKNIVTCTVTELTESLKDYRLCIADF